MTTLTQNSNGTLQSLSAQSGGKHRDGWRCLGSLVEGTDASRTLVGQRRPAHWRQRCRSRHGRRLHVEKKDGRLWIEIDAALVNNDVAVLVHEPSINQGGIDLQGPGQHHGHRCEMTVVSGASICSVLDGKADNGGVVGHSRLSLSTMKNENDRPARDTNSKIDALEQTTTTIEITVEMDRPRTVKKRLAAKAGCVREG